MHEAYGGKHAQRPVRLPSTAGVAGEFSGRCNVAHGNKQTVVAVVLRLPPVGLCPLRVEIYVLICFSQWLCCVFPAKAGLGRLFEGPGALAGSPRGCLCVAIGVLVAWRRVRFNQIINEWNKLSLMVCGASRRIIPLFGFVYRIRVSLIHAFTVRGSMRKLAQALWSWVGFNLVKIFAFEFP